MLEKNKDYVEMRVSSTDCAFTQNEPTSICIDGYVYTSYMRLPDPGEFYILISKEKFEKLLDKVVYYMALSTRHEANYNLLLEKTGFTSVADLVDYIHDPSMTSPEDKTLREIIDECEEDYISERDKALEECEDMKKKLEECEKDYISERDRAEALEKEIGVYSRALKDWKEGTGCPSPSAAKTLIESGASWHHAYNDIKAANENLGKVIESWQEATGYETPEKAMEHLSKLRDGRTHIVYLNDPLGVIAKWQKATGFDRPEAFLKWKTDIKGIMEAWKLKTGCTYPGEAGRLLEKWKTLTKCETPEAAATWITSYESACGRGNRLAESVKNLKEEVVSWKNVTGYSTPEDYMHARLNNATPFDYTAAWQKATGCTTPEQAKERIKALNERIDESKTDYNHLLCTTGFESEGEIEDALDKCDHSTLRKALVDYEFDYENLLKLTGYKSERDIRVALYLNEQFVYENMRELINSLKNKAKFTESNWQEATGRINPEAAKQYIDRLKGRLNKIHGCSVDW